MQQRLHSDSCLSITSLDSVASLSSLASGYLCVQLSTGDFNLGFQTVTFSPNTASASATVLVADDSLVEDAEGFSLSLLSPSLGTVIGSTARGVIVDNDSMSYI